MGIRFDLKKRIEKKRGEISTLEGKLKEAQVYIQALEDTLKMIPPDDDEDTLPSAAMKELREGTNIARSQEAILKAGRPLHINELLAALGKPDDKDAKLALSGSLAAYVRKNEIFTRPAPNTFGLADMKSTDVKVVTPKVPPPAFGTDSSAPAVIDDDVPF